MATSYNQQIFRDLSRSLNQIKRNYLSFPDEMGFDEFTSLLLDEMTYFLSDIQGNEEYWLNKANSLITRITGQVAESLDIKDELASEDTREEPNTFMLGLPILPRNYAPEETGIRYRNRVFTDMESILAYVAELPPGILRGIEPLYRPDGKFYGFRIWLYDDS